jgi:hypothetical protein
VVQGKLVSCVLRITLRRVGRSQAQTGQLISCPQHIGDLTLP